MRNSLTVLVGKHEWKIPLAICKRILEDNIKMDLKGREIGVVWIDLSQDRNLWLPVVHTLMNFLVPYKQ
jgi:hypothetical protein